MNDIVGSAPSSKYVITGFFTPNYRALAETFSANLTSFNVPHHLYAVAPMTWGAAIKMKPSIIRRARVAYPHSTVAFMDVDCILRGPIDQLFDGFGNCDVLLHMRVLSRMKRPDKVWSSSRLIAFGNTPKGEQLLTLWQDLCGKTYPRHVKASDEHLLLRAISQTGNLMLQTLPNTYAAWEVTDASPDAIIVHQTTRNYDKRSRIKKLRHAAISWVTGRPYHRLHDGH